jgi:hypothetical protein
MGQLCQAVHRHNATDAQRLLDKLTQHDHVKAKLVDDLPSERWSRTDLTTAPTFVGGMSATPIHLRDPR